MSRPNESLNSDFNARVICFYWTPFTNFKHNFKAIISPFVFVTGFTIVFSLSIVMIFKLEKHDICVNKSKIITYFYTIFYCKFNHDLRFYNFPVNIYFLVKQCFVGVVQFEFLYQVDWQFFVKKVVIISNVNKTIED